MNQIKQIQLFEKIWKIWKNRDKEPQARKALKVLCAQEKIDADRLLAAANIYALEIRSEHSHELGNWIRNDVWKDTYEEFKNIFAYEEKLKARRKECLELIGTWKRNRREWWCSILDEEAHIPNVEFALRNKVFKENWRAALKILHELFISKFPESDWRYKITPSITWFCKVDYDSSIVGKLMEGEYGKVKPEKKKFDPAKLFPKRDTMGKDEAVKAVASMREEVKKPLANPFKKKLKNPFRK